MTENKMTLGFIGLGLMGRPMAMRLLASGHPLYLWNRDPQKITPLIEAGGKACKNPAEVAAHAQITFLCLSNSAAVEEVTFGKGGIAQAAAKGNNDGKLVVDFSSIDPAKTRKIAQELHQQSGMSWVDAPISGGVPGAEQGTLAIMCGGAASDIERIDPILKILARRITHMGGTGCGQITKLCNQLIVSSNLVAIAEAMALGRHSGIDVQKLPAALAGGFADSLPLQIFGPRMAAAKFEPKIGALGTMLKDVNTIVDAADSARLPVSLIRQVQRIYQAAADSGLLNEDLTRISEFCNRPTP